MEGQTNNTKPKPSYSEHDVLRLLECAESVKDVKTLAEVVQDEKYRYTSWQRSIIARNLEIVSRHFNCWDDVSQLILDL